MKKLIVAFGVAITAISLTAATAKWSSGTITAANGAEAGKEAITATLWEFTSSTMYDQVVAGDYDVIANQSALDAAASAKLTGASNKRGIIDITGTSDVAADKGVWAVILYTDTTATGDGKYRVNASYSGEVGTTGVTVYELANQIGGKHGTVLGDPITSGWTSAATMATPEPTSGLLLLLGVAGLALKRKRA